MRLESFIGDWILVNATAAQGFQHSRQHEPRFYQSATYQELPGVLLRVAEDGSYQDIPVGGSQPDALLPWRGPQGVDPRGPSRVCGRLVPCCEENLALLAPHGVRTDDQGWLAQPEQALYLREVLLRQGPTLQRVLQTVSEAGLAQQVTCTYRSQGAVQDSLPERLCFELEALASAEQAAGWYEANEDALGGLVDMVAVGCIGDRQVDRLLGACQRLEAHGSLPLDSVLREPLLRLVRSLQSQLDRRGLTPVSRCDTAGAASAHRSAATSPTAAAG